MRQSCIAEAIAASPMKMPAAAFGRLQIDGATLRQPDGRSLTLRGVNLQFRLDSAYGRVHPWDDALVDRLVCEEADRFFGTDGSTFSLKITKLRNETREEAAGRDAPGVPSDGTDGTGGSPGWVDGTS